MNNFINMAQPLLNNLMNQSNINVPFEEMTDSNLEEDEGIMIKMMA